MLFIYIKNGLPKPKIVKFWNKLLKLKSRKHNNDKFKKKNIFGTLSQLFVLLRFEK